MMLVAALVVFANKVEDFNKTATQAKSERDAAQATSNRLTNEVTAVQGEKAKAIQEATDRVNAVKMLNDQLVHDNSDKASQVAAAKIETEKAQQATQVALDQSKAGQTAVTTAEGALQQARAQADDLQKKYNEAMIANSDVTNQLDVLKRRYEKAQQDVVALEEDNKRLREQVAQGPRPAAPGAGGAAAPGAGGATAAPSAPSAVALRGVVRSTKDIQGVKYATISLGTADNVQKQMQFRVVDRNAGQFLGYLTIDSLDSNEATGHLTGPNVNSVKAGNEVFTQWQ
jgi:hypothetical protein